MRAERMEKIMASPSNLKELPQPIQKYYQQGEVIVSDSGDKKKASRVIYDGVLSQMNALPKSEGKKEYFLYAGRIQPAKGLDQLLLAYSIYARKAEKPYLPGW